MIEWISVLDSTRIVAMAYNEEQQTIYVRFPEGIEWWYGDCSQLHWEEFRFAPSKGRYIREELDHHPNGQLV